MDWHGLNLANLPSFPPEVLWHELATLEYLPFPQSFQPTLKQQNLLE
jgi:hypothetical protein